MAKKRSARVVLNRRAVGQVELALADGVNAVAKAIVLETNAPDAEPYGEGLVMRGGWITYIADKKIDGGGTDGRQPKKPRAFRVRGSEVISAVAGWGFPAGFKELGTNKMAAEPFFAPARDRVIPRIPSIMAKNVAYRLARIG